MKVLSRNNRPDQTEPGHMGQVGPGCEAGVIDGTGWPRTHELSTRITHASRASVQSADLSV